jgi:hypothetical protein
MTRNADDDLDTARGCVTAIFFALLFYGVAALIIWLL